MHRKQPLGGFAASCLALAVFAGCGSGSSDTQGSTLKAERQAAAARSAGAVAQGQENRAKPVAGHPDNSEITKDSQAPPRLASRRTDNSEPARSHRARSSHHDALTMVEEAIAGAGDGGGNVKRTASTPKEIREVLEEVEHPSDPGSSSDSGSSSDPVQAVLEQIGH